MLVQPKETFPGKIFLFIGKFFESSQFVCPLKLKELQFYILIFTLMLNLYFHRASSVFLELFLLLVFCILIGLFCVREVHLQKNETGRLIKILISNLKGIYNMLLILIWYIYTILLI